MSEMKGDAMSLGQRLKHAWNAFTGADAITYQPRQIGEVSYVRPDRVRYRLGNERSILASIYTRIAIDVSGVKVRHVRLDSDERYISEIDSGLNYCLEVESNIDQTARAFMQDLVMSMLDEGVVAAVPVDTTINPRVSGSYDIQTMRTAKVTAWWPQEVGLLLYNDRTGKKEEIVLPKSQVAIIENPLYAVMNEPISTLKRLIYKFNLLDAVDETTSSGKLDMIIQLPFPIKTEMRRQEAEKRRRDIESQLTSNKYGIAYTDGVEKITQLSRPVENKLMEQIDYLTSMLYSQLGMTKEVFEGTADERVMMNYTNRTIEPIISAITDEFNRKFLTKTARSQMQRIIYFNDIFKLATMDSIATNGSQLVTSEVITRNELRQRMGYKPVDDPAADKLMNPNINPKEGQSAADQLANPNDNPKEGQPGGETPTDIQAAPYGPDAGERTLADIKVSEIP